MLPSYDPLAPFFRKPWVRVKNSSGEEIPPHSVLRVVSASFTDNEVVYTVAKPDGTYRWRYLVSWPRVIGSSSTSEGYATMLSEGGMVYYSGSSPSTNEMWGPTSGQWYLTQHRPGFLAVASSTTFNGKSLMVATQVIPGEIRVFNDSGGAVAAGGSATMSVYGGASGTTDTSMDVTLTNGSSVSWATSKYGSATIDMGGLIFGVPTQT